MNAFTFLCDQNTGPECLQRLLFGTNRGPVYPEPLSRVQVGDYLFLWNYDTGILQGPFLALTPCTANIEPNAWRDAPGHAHGFPFQVRVDARLAYQESLTADDLARAGLLHNTRLGPIPDAQLDPEQLKSILEMLRSRNGEAGPPVLIHDAPVVPGTDSMITTAFIFKCDATTGGRCFAENIMGAPMPVFRNVVSAVQPGAKLFLWQINERRLYGVWKARTRGQYDPTAFPEAAGRGFHAVVHCDREHNLPKGIDEATVRSSIAYDDNMPPYKISPPEAEKLTEALLAANGMGDPSAIAHRPDALFLADDGHRVRSQGELIIDNMLFGKGHLHAYERRVQVGNKCLRCDFYLPPGQEHREIYVEYWGMMSDPQYAHRRQEKLALYRQASIEPLELFPAHLQLLAEAWPAMLAQYANRST